MAGTLRVVEHAPAVVNGEGSHPSETKAERERRAKRDLELAMAIKSRSED